MLKSCFLLLMLGLTQALVTWPPWNLKICKSWNCINDQLGFSFNESRPVTREEIEMYLNRRLTDGMWRDDIKTSLDTCFAGKKLRFYSRICPGQEMWHCIVDQLIQNCPAERTNTDNSCNLVGSVVGAKYLFYQNVYLNNVNSSESIYRRPKFFLKQVFKSKCCNLDDLFAEDTMKSCNVTTFLKSVRFEPSKPQITHPRPELAYRASQDRCLGYYEKINPFACCDISSVLKAENFDECSFNMEWDKTKDLHVVTDDDPSTEKGTEVPHNNNITFVKVVPETAKPLSCVLETLNISRKGVIDQRSFESLLDDMTRSHPAWRFARAHVAGRCFQRDLKMEYAGSPEQRLLACTIDVLSGSCPHGKKGFADPCRRHATKVKPNTVCQISNSKFRQPPHLFCDVPRLVAQKTLQSCGLISLTKMEVLKPPPPTPKPKKWLDLSASASGKHNKSTDKKARCVLSKMGVIKNDKIDHDELAKYVNLNLDSHWEDSRKAKVTEAIKTEATSKRFSVYDEATSTLLGLVDAVVNTCPPIKKKDTQKCKRFFDYTWHCTNKTLLNPYPTHEQPIGINIFNLSRQILGYPTAHTVHSNYAPRYVYTNFHSTPNINKNVLKTPIINHVYRPIVYTNFHSTPNVNKNVPKTPIINHVYRPIPLLNPMTPSGMYNPRYMYGHGYDYTSHVTGQLRVRNAFKTNAPLNVGNKPTRLEHPFPVQGQVYV